MPFTYLVPALRLIPPLRLLHHPKKTLILLLHRSRAQIQVQKRKSRKRLDHLALLEKIASVLQGMRGCACTYMVKTDYEDERGRARHCLYNLWGRD
jgi:hypothetical protein